MTPGPIAINAATFVGTRVAGIPGAMAATVGCILPACILVTLIARLYLKYRDLAVLQGVLGSLRPAVVAMIASAGILILLNAFWGGAGVTLAGTNWVMAAIFAGCFALLRGTKLSPIAVMLLGRRGESARLHPAVFKMRCSGGPVHRNDWRKQK